MNNNKRPITKLTLYLHAMKKIIIVSVSIFVAINGMLLIVAMPPDGVRASYFLTGLIFAGVTAALCALLPLQGLYLLKKQERFLGFRFYEEMERYHINQLPYSTGKWFLAAKGYKIIAIRKDYIIGLENYTGYYPGNPNGLMPTSPRSAKITIVGADGKMWNIQGFLPGRRNTCVISDLRDWYDSYCTGN